MNALEHRVPPPIMVMIVGAVMWLIARYTGHVPAPDGWRLSLAAAVFALGLAFLVSGFLAFRRAQTTIDPVHLHAASVLVSTGIFSFSRNPMYLGFTILLTAWALYLSSPWAMLGVVAFVLFIHRFQILPEEHVMRAKFGSAYSEYQRRVRRWL